MEINNPLESTRTNTQYNSDNDSTPLKFKSKEELGGSIFVQDDNGKVEMSDIKGSLPTTKMLAIKDFLQPAIDACQNWTQELICGVEKVISDFYSNLHNMSRKEQAAQALRDNNSEWGALVGPNSLKWLYDQNVIDKHGNYIPAGVQLQESGTYIASEEDKANLTKIFSNAKFVDTFNDHNQMLDAIEYARNNGVNIDEIDTLINFDTHSDLYINGTRNHETIADWINSCLSKNPNMTDFYWVVPTNMVYDKEVGNILNGTDTTSFTRDIQGRRTPLFRNVGTVADLQNEESVQTYLIGPDDASTRGDIRYVTNEDEIAALKQKGYRELKVHICTAENLPSFKGHKVITSLDMDYFSNSGVDTIREYRDNKTAEELNEAMSDFLRTMVEKDIQPVIHGSCFSDDYYLPPEDLKQAEEFAAAILETSPQKGKDLIDRKDYKHEN